MSLDEKGIRYIGSSDGTWIFLAKTGDDEYRRQIQWNKRNWKKYGYDIWIKHPELFNKRVMGLFQLYEDTGFWEGDYHLVTDRPRIPKDIYKKLREIDPSHYPELEE